MISRRTFLRDAAATALGFYALRECVLSQDVFAQAATASATGRYGDLVTDRNKILDLPRDFSYRVISRSGQPMHGGLRVPGMPDGMAAFGGPNGKVILVRNHELQNEWKSSGPFGNDLENLKLVNRAHFYDFGGGTAPSLGGTTTLLYNPAKGAVENQWLSLAGTIRNCAGGPTPWNSWITCEETVYPKGTNGAERDHGYNFEVPATATPRLAAPIALEAMGRFNHEAIAVDAKTGIVYQTEDRDNGLIYRFIPNMPGQLARGGKLQALAARDTTSLETRNWDFATRLPKGIVVETRWIDMDEVHSPKDDLRTRGFASGAAVFARGEGMWSAVANGKSEIYWACTNGGQNKKGQIWRYLPSPFEGTAQEAKQPGRLELWAEPNDGDVCNNADNLTVSPRGDVYFAEDGKAPNGIAGISRKGELFRFARVNSSSELAGVCFAPDGKTMFFNAQKDGLTFAVTGPF
ncbi:MAG TPA: alkaline phosphatase PhoX [Abditibacteriaceae bacterium]|jgi:hypothetical protein